MLAADQDRPAPLDDDAAQLLSAASTKDAAGENFPVASLLLPAAARPVVLAFYRLARTADDIADSPSLDRRVKLGALDATDAALRGDPPGPLAGIAAVRAASAAREALLAAGVPVEHARQLLQAFRKDAMGATYRDWGDLLLYCSYSAAPVGRFLLDLHREDRAARAFADPLCNAHQILNHVQDCGADYRRLRRVYLPRRWLDEAGATVDMLAGDRLTAPLRAVLDRVLAGAERLLAAAAPLPDALCNRGLRIQSRATLAMGWRLLAALRGRDPLAGRVALARVVKAGCVAGAAIRGWRAPAASRHG